MEDHIWQISQRVSFKEHYGKEYLFALLVSVFDKVRILLLCRIKSLVFPWNVLQSKVILLKLILSFLHDKNMKMLLQRMKKQYRTKYFYHTLLNLLYCQCLITIVLKSCLARPRSSFIKKSHICSKFGRCVVLRTVHIG